MKTALVVTTISSSKTRFFADAIDGCRENQWQLIVVGDRKTPEDFALQYGTYLNPEQQNKLSFRTGELLPFNHYSRKNLGYLVAITNGADVIVETDDDNIPYANFWDPRIIVTSGDFLDKPGWVNVYKYFGGGKAWPRGLPLENASTSMEGTVLKQGIRTLIQQGLADGDPDVDAIFRLTCELPVEFKTRSPLILSHETVCPFNSQNTTWFKDAFRLMYLPSTCSFRMTDIWRSFVAQRILRTLDGYLAFHESTVKQDRNPHDLVLDLKNELDGYLYNQAIVRLLSELWLESGSSSVASNMMKCYEALVEADFLQFHELHILEAWLGDCSSLKILDERV